MSSAITPFDFYLLRLPSLPIGLITQLHQAATAEDLAQAIFGIYQLPELQEAIFLASPELHGELLKWLSKPAEQAVQDERIVLTLYKYLLRMCSRCTPYGLFAGFSTGHIGAGGSSLHRLSGTAPQHRHARLDMNAVAKLSKQVEKEAHLRPQLTFFANNSLYKANDTYRYYQYRMKDTTRRYYLVAVRATRYLALVLQQAQLGASYASLLEQLVQADAELETAQQFLNRLIDAQLLVSELEQTVTGPEFYGCLLEKLTVLRPDYAKLPLLREMQRRLTGPQVSLADYQHVQDSIRQAFPAGAGKDLIQVDLRLQMPHNQLSQAVVAELGQELSELTALFKGTAPAALKAFAQAFTARFEEQEIPLLEALDTETGLGYGSSARTAANHTPLVGDLRLPAKSTPATVAWTAYRRLVFKKFQEGVATPDQPVSIGEAELRELGGEKAVRLPATLFAMGSLIANSPAALDAGDFQFQLLTCHGPGAMPVMARFGHADPVLATKLAACAEVEQRSNEEVLVAEIVHVPEDRLGNVLQRPQLRAYEIPFLGQASVSPEHQLPVSDLLVAVRNGRVVLRSKRLNRVVQPSLTTAHNYRQGLPIYKFLCDLQTQHDAFAITWDWGVLQAQPFLPRVEYKRIILSRARWLLSASAHQALGAAGPAEVAAFRAHHRLPQRVVLADADNELLLDLACPLAVKVLAQRLKLGSAVVYEFVPDPAATLVTDEQGHGYVNELIIPFAGPQRAAPVAAAVRPVALRPTTRSFALGSEWTFLKIYCGAKWADKALTEYLLPVLAELEELGIVQQWFFIRYQDPEPHLRLRLRHEPHPAAVAAVVDRLHRALGELQQTRIISRLQYDTYHRELERYGRAPIEFSESIFYYDSQAVVRFLSLIEGEEGERYRWLFAIRGVDQLLEDFGLSLAEKSALAADSQRSFFYEFGGNASLTHQLNDKYRAVSRLLTDFMREADTSAELAEAIAVFAERSRNIREACQAVQGELTSTDDLVEHLLPSYLHMFLNRIFPANQRLHELVVYHFLTKYYASVRARQHQLAPAL